ncbi:MAG TPA: SBBP repeat-containing protein, partial [Candidatus Acidoferrales bacterium]
MTPRLVLQTVEREISGQMVNETRKRLPLLFEPSLSQTDARAWFLTRAQGMISRRLASTGSVRRYNASPSSIRKPTGDTARRASYSFLTGKPRFAPAKLGQQDRFGDRTLAGVSTYLEGSGADRAYSIAVDSTGAVYVTGHTNANNFPTNTGAYQTGEG